MVRIVEYFFGRLFCRLGAHEWAMNRWGVPYWYCPHCDARYQEETHDQAEA